MRALIVAITLLAIYALPTPAGAVTFHPIPPMMVLSPEESQDMMRKEWLARMVEEGQITESEAQGMHSIKVHSIVLENGLWGLVVIPTELGQEVGTANQ